MRLVLYGGTFDPIHHGHLILARDALERLEADEVIFIPAAISPHKLRCTPAPPLLRREMVAQAIAGEPPVRMSALFAPGKVVVRRYFAPLRLKLAIAAQMSA